MSDEQSQPNSAAAAVSSPIVPVVVQPAPATNGRAWWTDPKNLVIVALLGGGGIAGTGGTLFVKNGGETKRIEKLEEKFETYQNEQRARDARLDDRLRKIEIDTAKVLTKLESFTE